MPAEFARNCTFRCADRLIGNGTLTHITLGVIITRMIRSFACRETEKLFNDEPSRRLPPQIQSPARRKLLLLHQSRSLQDLRAPYGNHLEALKGDRAGQHSIRINDQWRLCFRWRGEDAFDIEVVDYH